MNLVCFISQQQNGRRKPGRIPVIELGNYSDNPLNIYENRSIVARKFYKSSRRPITPHQTHSNKVRYDTNFSGSSQYQ